MDYIKLLTDFFEKAALDDRLSPSHISMYMSIFQYLNINHFQNPISISRYEIMRISKIASPATYHKCIKELNTYGYFKYSPSFNPFKGSLVTLFDLAPKIEEFTLESVKLLSIKDSINVNHFDIVNMPQKEGKADSKLIKNQRSCSPNKVIHTNNQTGCQDLTNKRTGYPKSEVIHTNNRTGCDDITKKRTGGNSKTVVIHTISPTNGGNHTNKRTGCPENEVIHTINQTGSKKIPPQTIISLDIINLKENYIKENYIKEKFKKEKEILKILDSEKNNMEMKNEKSFEKKETKKKIIQPNLLFEVNPKIVISDIGGGGKMKIPTIEEVSAFFILKNYAVIESEKFFNYFQSNGWLVGGKAKMKDWNAAARNWIINSKTFHQPKTPSTTPTNLHNTQNKNYNEPL